MLPGRRDPGRSEKKRGESGRFLKDRYYQFWGWKEGGGSSRIAFSGREKERRVQEASGLKKEG